MPAAISHQPRPGPDPAGTGPPRRRSDAGTVQFTARDIAGLVLTGDMYGAPTTSSLQRSGSKRCGCGESRAGGGAAGWR